MKLRIFLLVAAILLSACTGVQERSATEQAQDTTKAIESSAPHVLGDAAIATQIEARFVGIDADSALHVAVGSHDGNVTLSGRAKSAPVADRFVAAAKEVPGVKGVSSTIRSDPTIPRVGDQARDALTVTAVTGALLAQTGINATTVKVAAHAGDVTLSGDVRSKALKATMVDTARQTTGVKRVIDKLTVKSS